MSAVSWQDIPDWLIFAARQHALTASGQDRAGEEAVDRLTERLMSADPGFARAIIARYVRSLLRAPKPRKRVRDRDRDRRMAECVRLSAEGLSLRAVGERAGVSHTMVAKFLAEWQTRLPEMTAELIRLSTPAVNQEAGPLTPQVDNDPRVIPLRRPA